MDSLKNYLVSSAPQTVYYIPNFITPDEEDYIINKVDTAPKPKWTCLKNRRLQDYGGIPHKNGLILEPIPSWLPPFMDRISDLGVFGNNRANHVLVNEYLPGQGIMAHLDGPVFFPTITTISCGSHTILEFEETTEGDCKNVCNLLLERRSLVIMQDNMYEKYKHSISEIQSDIITDKCVNLKFLGEKCEIGDELQRERRISLTIRNVPKVCKVNLLAKMGIENKN